jgi:RHS repeat-associated protein
VTEPQTRTKYTYDAEGRRAEKATATATTVYIHDLAGKPVAEWLSTMGWAYGYVYLGGQLVAQYSSGTTHFAYSDHLGSTRLVTDLYQNVAQNLDYLPYGELISTDTGIDTYKFTGKERDSESGLDNFDFRYNSSSLGRFMSPDPLGGSISNPQSLNGYAYVLNNPLNLIDPLGLDAQQGCVTATIRDDQGNLWGSSSSCSSPEQPDLTNAIAGNTANLVPLPPSPSAASGDTLPDQATSLAAGGPGAGSGVTPGLDATQLGLGGLGMIPGPIGTGANLINAGISFYRGNYGQGALDLAFAIPLVGTIGRLGEAGELAAGIIKNGRRIRSLTGTAAFRVPDELNDIERVIGEVKNVRYQAYTNQLKDYAAYAQKYGYQFRLYIRQGAKLSGPLQDAINSGLITHIPF